MEKTYLLNTLGKIIHDGSGRADIAEIITQIDAPHYPDIIKKISENLLTSQFSRDISPQKIMRTPDEHGRLKIGTVSSLEKESNVTKLVEKALGLTTDTLLDFKRFYHVTKGGFEIETGYELDKNMNYTKSIDVFIHVDNAEKLLNTLTLGIPKYDMLASLARNTRDLMSRLGAEFLSLDITEKSRMSKGLIVTKQKSAFALAIILCEGASSQTIAACNKQYLSQNDIALWLALRDEIKHYQQAWQSHRMGTYTDTKFDLELKKRMDSYINVAGKEETSRLINVLNACS